MSQHGIHFQLLLPGSAEHLCTGALAKLRPNVVQVTEPAPFTALDCFDQSLRRSGRLLLKTDDRFTVLRDDARAVSQTVKGKPRFISDFPGGPLKRALAGLSPLRSLLPIGSGSRQQTTLAFTDDEGKTHCRVKLLTFHTEEDRHISLVEVQGIKGYGKSLDALCEHIESLGGVSSSCGVLYNQLFPSVSAYDPKPVASITGAETAFEAANKIIATGLPVLRANEAGIIADHDTEFLHDYRVQIRKIRSVLSLFKGVYEDAQTAELKARFSALAAPTGRLRDLDVYLLTKPHYSQLLPESLQPGLDALFKVFGRHRAEEQKALAQHLRSTAYKREITALEKLFKRAQNLKPGIYANQSAQDYAAERIWQHYRKVRKAAESIGPDTPDAEIHELRIRCKKLRYLMEFFAPVFPKAALNTLLKALKRLQEHLGLFNDYSVQQEKLQAFLSAPEKGRGSNIEIAQSLGALIAVLHRMQLEERDKIISRLVLFNRPGIQQTFSDLFQNRRDDT